jgi:hypothetical protein
MKAPPKRAPRKVDSTEALRKFQRMMAAALTRPLSGESGLQPKWIDGRPMSVVAAEFIKPNDRMTSVERLELYGQMYWHRITESLKDDCPGLIAVLGEAGFERLAKAYLTRHPSHSFTLRNLSSRLVDFLRARPALTAPRTALALEVARFEWAQTVAFDSEALPPATAESLAGTPPSRLRLGIQPYMTLLDLRHPVDTFMISVRRRQAMRSEASNAPGADSPRAARVRRARIPKPSRTLVVVHRHRNRLYYKRLSPAAFRILSALAAGRTLEKALWAGGPEVRPSQVRGWFKSWMALGWFCRHRR